MLYLALVARLCVPPYPRAADRMNRIRRASVGFPGRFRNRVGIHEANPSKTWKNACRHGSSRSSSGIVRHRPGETSIQLCTDMEPSTRGAQSNSEGDTYAACVPQGPTEVSAALWQLTAPRLPIGSPGLPARQRPPRMPVSPFEADRFIPSPGDVAGRSLRRTTPIAAPPGFLLVRLG